MIVHYSENAKEQIGQYYEAYQTNYRSGYQQNDLEQRVNNYRQIANTLYYLNQYLNQTYVKNGRNFIAIGNIATVEFIRNKKDNVIVKNIYFRGSQNNSNYQNQQSNQTQQTNQQQQIQYQPVSNQYFYGLMMVKSTNGLFNFVNKDNQIFHPNQWFNQAYDFKKENNGAICARVEYNKQWYLLALDGKLYTMGNVNGYTNENYRQTIQTILAEQQIGESLNFMQRLLNYRFW